MTPFLPLAHPRRFPMHTPRPQRGAAVGVAQREGVPRESPLLWAEEPGSPERATAQPKVTEPRGTHQARDGCPFQYPALLTSRRLRSAGCSLRERLSRYCQRGLSSGGSRRCCRRNRHGGHRLPARERVDQGLGLWDTSGQPEPCARNRELCSSPLLRVRPSARPPTGAMQGLHNRTPLTQEEASGESGTQSCRA